MCEKGKIKVTLCRLLIVPLAVGCLGITDIYADEILSTREYLEKYKIRVGYFSSRDIELVPRTAAVGLLGLTRKIIFVSPEIRSSMAFKSR